MRSTFDNRQFDQWIYDRIDNTNDSIMDNYVYRETEELMDVGKSDGVSGYCFRYDIGSVRSLL